LNRPIDKFMKRKK